MPVVIFSGIPQFWKKLLFSDNLLVYVQIEIMEPHDLAVWNPCGHIRAKQPYPMLYGKIPIRKNRLIVL